MLEETCASSHFLWSTLRKKLVSAEIENVACKSASSVFSENTDVHCPFRYRRRHNYEVDLFQPNLLKMTFQNCCPTYKVFAVCIIGAIHHLH